MNKQNISLSAWVATCIQLGLLIALALSGPVLVLAPAWLLLEAAAVGIGFWAVFTMRGNPWRILPNAPAGNQLHTRGPYRIVRHPMYTCVLFVSLAWMLNQPTPLRIALWFLLAVDLALKIRIEERDITAKHPGYEPYRQRTPALIPRAPLSRVCRRIFSHRQLDSI